jgi:hypothetical protein
MRLGAGLGLTRAPVVAGGFNNQTSISFDGVDEFAYGDIVGGSYQTAVIRTFGMWVKMTDTGFQPFFCGNTTTIPAMPLFRWANGGGVYNGRLRWTLDNYRASASFCRAYSEVLDGTGSLPNIGDGNWHHVAIYNPVDSEANRANIVNCKMWVDGVSLAVTTDVGTQAVRGFGTNLILGAGSGGSWSGQEYFDGQMDEFAYWDRLLTDAEVLEIGVAPTDLNSFSGGLPGSWYRGDADTYPTILDHGTNSNNLTMYNQESGDLIADAP